MSRILLCGVCPLPFEDCQNNPGPGIRTWQFSKALAVAGHEVHLLAMTIDSCYDTQPQREEEHDLVKIVRLSQEDFFAMDFVGKYHARLWPDSLVGATVYGSNVLARLHSPIPFWADQFGHVMAEAQAKARLEGEDWPVAHFWELLEPVLRSADHFSVVSERQRWALVGELGILGRLSAKTCGYEFTSVIPCALEPQPVHFPVRRLRGSTIPSNAFIVLWSGGYNVWSDVDTLFSALELAMSKEERIHFVSTGGGIQGHDESSYARFEDLIADSDLSDRYHLLGWIPREQVGDYVAEADLGVLCELPIYEGALGSKNRIVQWMGSGLPVLYNRFGEIGELLLSEELGLTFPVSDIRRMAELILWAAEHPSELAEMSERAQQYCQTSLTVEATTRDLVDWVERPVCAPDRLIRSEAHLRSKHGRSS